MPTSCGASCCPCFCAGSGGGDDDSDNSDHENDLHKPLVPAEGAARTLERMTAVAAGDTAAQRLAAGGQRLADALTDGEVSDAAKATGHAVAELVSRVANEVPVLKVSREGFFCGELNSAEAICREELSDATLIAL